MNIYLNCRKKICSIIQELQQSGELPADLHPVDFRVEPPADSTIADVVSNIALVLGGTAGKAPLMLAALFQKKLELDPDIEKIDIGGNGFLNLYLTEQFWLNLLQAVLRQPGAFMGMPLESPSDPLQSPLLIRDYMDEKSTNLTDFRAGCIALSMVNLQNALGSETDIDDINIEDCEEGKKNLLFHFRGKQKQSILCGTASLIDGGAAIKMPENEIALFSDSLCFSLLGHKNRVNIEMEIDKVVDQSRDNQFFYVQYTHAQIFSVFRNTHLFSGNDSLSQEKLTKIRFQDFENKEEIGFLKKIAEYPWHLYKAHVSCETQYVAFFLYGLARDFHAIWGPGKEVPQLRFNKEDEREYSIARFALLKAVAIVIASGLQMLGVKPIEEMR